MNKDRKAYDKKYRNTHKMHRRYLSYRSTSKTFIRKYAKPNDVLALRHLWNQRLHVTIQNKPDVTDYEDLLIDKLKKTSRTFTKYLEDMATWHFGTDRVKACLVTMGHIEAYARALILYDPQQTDFCKKLIAKGNQLLRKANEYADTHK